MAAWTRFATLVGSGRRAERRIALRHALYASSSLTNLAAVDDLDRPVAGGHQFLVGDDAQQVVDRGGQVLDRSAGRLPARWRSASDVP